MKAWHFTSDKLRCGAAIPAIGEKLIVEPPIALCEYGLHASLDPFDALRYAPGNNLHLVELSGEIIQGADKLVATERTIIKSLDATDLLREFARWNALNVIHLWNAPPIVREYLETGDESLRAAARDAARVAARAAARDAAWVAAWAAAWAAARAAADAARAAANAAWATARDAAWAAAREKFNSMVKEAFEQ